MNKLPLTLTMTLKGWFSDSHFTCQENKARAVKTASPFVKLVSKPQARVKTLPSQQKIIPFPLCRSSSLR